MANPTTNYGWPMPTSTDLVTDLPADFAAFGQPVDTSLKALNPETTLGDIAYRSATSNTNTRLGIGSTGQVLTVASGVPSWATPAVSTPTFVGCVVTKSTTQTVATATHANITWNVETFDTNGFHDNATNNTRITIPSGYAGKYYVTTTIGWGESDVAGNKVITIRKNGADFFYNEYPDDDKVDFINTSGVMSLAVADYIEVRVRQSSGVTVNVFGDDYNASTSSFFSATYLGA